jgi:hypothetical protein
MPDPDIDAALAEAYASAPTGDDDIVVHTIEIRHPSFVDDDENPTSIFLVHDHANFEAALEDDAPIKPGEMVEWIAIAFSFALAPIETSPKPQILIEIDNVGRDITDLLDAAIIDGRKVEVCYRPYLNGDRTGPKMSVPPVYTMSNVEVDVFRVTARANTGADLGVAFPRELYKPAKFPGLIGL